MSTFSGFRGECAVHNVAALFGLGLTLSVIGTLGCGGSTERLPVHPVTGRIEVRGRPAAGAEICLYGLDDHLKVPVAPVPRGTVGEDGVFVLSSYGVGDGAPAGRYSATVVWRQGQHDDPEMQDRTPDRLRGRYADPERSELTVDVAEGENELDVIQLK